MRSLFLICVCVLLVAGTAMATDRTVVVTPVTGNALSINQAADGPACNLGNPNDPALAITDWIWGHESYKYLFDANQPDCQTCGSGFKVSAVHMYVQFGVDAVPVTFQCSADFEETVVDPTSGCFMPGPMICESPVYNVTIEDPGLYDISLPLLTENCPCAFFGYKYAIGFNFLTVFDYLPDAVTDGTPIGCTSYYNDLYASGWVDLLSFGFPGELNMYADIMCCDNPVANESSSWGALKSLFR